MNVARGLSGRSVAALLGGLLVGGGLLGCGGAGQAPVEVASSSAASSSAASSSTASSSTASSSTESGDARVEVRGAPGVDTSLVERVRADVVAALGHVRSVWDGAWSDRVEVYVVADGAAVAAEAAGFAVGAGALDEVAAVAVVSTAAGASTPAGASTAPAGEATGRATDSAGSDAAAPSGRLVVNAEVYDRLSDVGGKVVTRHEVTHLASAAATPPDLPVWLVEGFADAVARVGLADRPAPAAVELAAEVEAGRVPAGLPADEAFAGADGRLAQTYQQAWLACRLVVERAGIDGLVQLYRAAGTGTAGSPSPSASAAARLDVALRDVVDLDLTAFTAVWRGYLVDVLA